MVKYQQLSKHLKHHGIITQLVDARENTLNEALEAAESACTELLNKLGVEVLKIDDKDAAAVFDAYFTGTGFFCQPKHRNDIPDAFIYCAAKRFIATKLHHSCLAVCGDGNLHKALTGWTASTLHSA